MSEPTPATREFSREDMQSALFAQLVIQQTNIAMMLLGKTPHPETGETIRDLEAARMFIDQLEMLEAKTKNNLTPQETALLRQSLSTLQMAFVEAVESPPSAANAAAPAAEKSAAPENKTAPTEIIGAAGETEESHKRFSKKY